jgi:hypothetical protein
VEHLCYQCRASVDDGVAFCPQCNAPQIRVAGTLQTSAKEPEIGSALPASRASQSAAIQWSQALPAAALAGLIAAFLMVIPMGVFGLGMVAAGAISVLLYRRRNPFTDLTPRLGARLGALSGALGFGIFAIFISIQMVLFSSGGQLRAALLDAVQQSAARNSDPQAQQIFEYFKTPQGLALMMGVGLLVMFIAFLVFSSVGGALAAALLRRKERP